MREIVSPTNPKTESQLLQRIVMHTVMAAYSKMKEICDHSFEGLKKGQDTMSYFMKQNVQFAREKIATMQQQGNSHYEMYNFAPLGMKGFTPNQYQVAMGSLPRVPVTINDDEAQYGVINTPVLNTYASVIAALGLRRGDQLTFILINAFSGDYGACDFSFARVILDPTNADGTAAPLSTPFIDENHKINLPSVRNEGKFYFTYDAASQHIQFGRQDSMGGFAGCVIVSRKSSDETWLRSTTYLTYVEGANGAYSLGECLDMAKNGNAAIYNANELYLNNAGQGGSDVENSAEAAAITSVTADEMNVIAGTVRELSFPSNTQFPQEVVIDIRTSNANGKTIAIMNGNTEVASEQVSSNLASITAEVRSGITYRVAWKNGEQYTNTAYQFKVVTAGSAPSGDVDDGD